MILFTIGHSNRAIEDFVKLLRDHDVQRIADVRRFPGSRKWPHFNREALAPRLAAEGIAYEWFEALGGRRSPRDLSEEERETIDSAEVAGLENKSFQSYARYMHTSTFEHSLNALLERASTERVALMCSEAVWWRCHRRLISDVLAARGHAVLHILTSAAPKPHIMTDVAQVRGNQVIYPALL